MNTNKTLNINALSLERQTLLTSTLIGHSVELSNGKFSDSSKESLSNSNPKYEFPPAIISKRPKVV